MSDPAYIPGKKKTWDGKTHVREYTVKAYTRKPKGKHKAK